jgi:hypothetical protein
MGITRLLGQYIKTQVVPLMLVQLIYIDGQGQTHGTLGPRLSRIIQHNMTNSEFP